MDEIKKIDNFIATKNAPLRMNAGAKRHYGKVTLAEEGFILLEQNTELEIDQLEIQKGNQEYHVLAAGSDGEDGGPAEDGQAGADGGAIKLVIKELSDDITVVTRGGNGGDGGYGGAGGNGGDGMFNGNGACGGDGGNGGAGGNGGKGPEVTLKCDLKKINVLNLKSRGGSGGMAGPGGHGGKNGTRDTFAPDGKPGKQGEMGKEGHEGRVIYEGGYCDE